MKRFCSLILALLLTAAVLPPVCRAAGDGVFSDVDSDAWYASCVTDAVRRGLMKGTGDGRFSPEGDLTRAMLVTVLWRLAGEPETPTPAPFTDTPPGRWDSEAIAWSASFRVTEGYGDGRFGPEDPVTREQMSVLFYRWAQGKNYDVSFPGGDLEQVGLPGGEQLPSDWAADAVSWAADRSFLTRRLVRRISPMGGSAYLYLPSEVAGRAEVAVFLSRFCRTYVDEDKGEENRIPCSWECLTMTLPELWQGCYSAQTADYDGVPAGRSIAFWDLSNVMPQSHMGRLFDLVLWPEGVDSSWFGGWEKLGDAAPGKSGRLCTVQAPEGKLALYVTYPELQTEEGFEIRYYNERNPRNYLKMRAEIEEILQSIRFAGGITVLDTASGYSALRGSP